MVKVLRAPIQKEIDAHEATHVPHEEWCEFCMSGRARNKPHKRKGRTPDEPEEGPEEDSDVSGAPSVPDTEEVPPSGPVT